MKERYSRAVALTIKGHALVELEQLQAAKEAYLQAVEIWRDNDQYFLAVDPISGLARLALHQDQPAQALELVEEILTHLETNSLDGTLDPYWI